MVTLDGAELWTATGDPLVPVMTTTLLLPQGTRLGDVTLIGTSHEDVLASQVNLVKAPNPVSFDSEDAESQQWDQVCADSLTPSDLLRFETHLWGGYSVATIAISPVVFDASQQTLGFFQELEFQAMLTEANDPGVLPCVDPTLQGQIASAVGNPELLSTYTVTPLASGDTYSYVIITSATLSAEFQPLVQDKISQGVSARIVTTEWIAQNYQGTENGDLADRIRGFLRDSYIHHGTRYVLLGGDSEIIPARGVYTAVGSGTVDTSLASDMYYACLDGPWNGDGDQFWGETTDGINGGDIDLMPELFVGRAPVSDQAEARNFVNKTLVYSHVAHPNADTVLLVGEKLDSATQGSTSNEIIRQQTLPADRDVVTLYDTSTSSWTTAQVLDQLNASPNLVHHLGHANASYVARMTTSQVAALTNVFPFIMYSQGCDAGSFDTLNLAIAEQMVVAPHAAVATIMNTRYGWYVPGATPGGSHDYALAFFDAIFNQHKTTLGEAFVDSKLDNLFRVSAGGAFRWIHLTSTLFGDPQLTVQTSDWQPPQQAEICGVVYCDDNGNGIRDTAEAGKAGEIVYLDLDRDGHHDAGSQTFTQSRSIELVDYGTTKSQLVVSGVGQIHDLTVTVNLTHTYDADLSLTLISPSGHRIRLASNVGGAGDNFLGTVFDDAADSPVDSGTAPFTGRFQPQDPLALLQGENADGIWTLEITDATAWDTGTLQNWSITFTYDEPFAVTDAQGQYHFIGLSAGTYVVRHEIHEIESQGNTTPGLDGKNIGDPGQTVSLGGDQKVTVDFAVAQPVNLVEWGTITDKTIVGDLGSRSLYAVTAGQDGILSVIVEGANASPSLTVLYDAQGQVMASLGNESSATRWDWQVQGGQRYFLRFSNVQGPQEVRLVNLVDITPDSISVRGTQGNDQIELSLPDHQLIVNGIVYSLAPASSVPGKQLVQIDTLAGEDSLSVRLGDGDASLQAGPLQASIAVNNQEIHIVGAEQLVVRAGSGESVAQLSDSPGDDNFICRPGLAELSGSGFRIQVESFSIVHGYSRMGGDDVASLYDSAGNDRFVGRPEQAVLSGDGYYFRAKFFRYVHAYSLQGGYDTAQLYGSSGNDILVSQREFTRLSSQNYFLRAKFFDSVTAKAGQGGRDTATIIGSPLAETLTAGPRWAELVGPGRQVHVQNFASVRVDGQTGRDTAMLYDSPQDDHFTLRPGLSQMNTPGYQLQVLNFEEITARSQAGGQDVAELFDSPGNDRFISLADESELSGPGFLFRVQQFAIVHGYSTKGGQDVAILYGDEQPSRWVVRQEQTTVTSSDCYRRAKAFEEVFAHGGGQMLDAAMLYDSAGNDLLEVLADRMAIKYAATQVHLQAMGKVNAVSKLGNDRITGQVVDNLLSLVGSWR